MLWYFGGLRFECGILEQGCNLFGARVYWLDGVVAVTTSKVVAYFNPALFRLLGLFEKMSRRAAEPAAGRPSPSRRRLSAGDVVIATPMRATMGPRAAAAPIVVTICKWANKAAEVFPAATSQDVPVWQLQIVHDSRPSVTFGFLAALRGFLPELELESMDELEQRKNFRVVIAGGQNPRPRRRWCAALACCHVCSIVDPRRGFGVPGWVCTACCETPEFAVCGALVLHVAAQSAIHLGGVVPEPWQMASDTLSPAPGWPPGPV